MEDGRWVTISGAHVFVKDGQSPMDAFIKQKGGIQKTPETLNNRKNLVDYFRIQTDIDLEKAATEKQFAPRRGLNIDSRKLDKNEFFTLRTQLNKKGISIQSNGVYDYFITYEKKK